MATVPTPEPAPEDVANILDAAADHLEKVGHCNSGPTTEAGEVCAVIALGHVTGVFRPSVRNAGRAFKIDLFQDALRAVEEHLGLELGYLPKWNDQPHRTGDDVTTVFRDVAIKLRPDTTTGATL